MKENETKKTTVRITEGKPETIADTSQRSEQNLVEKFKKPLILGLMGVVFVGCMYLIFKPTSDSEELSNIGLNDAVPQATETGLPTDKGKAYELEMLQKNEQEKRNQLNTLSDYWSIDNGEKMMENLPDDADGHNHSLNQNPNNYGNPSLHSYRNMQHTLGSFYQDDYTETMELRKQLEELREKLAEKDIPIVPTVDDQLKIMEKSYAMAAKYLPSNTHSEKTPSINEEVPTSVSVSDKKEHFVPIKLAKKNTVSALYREPTDSAFLADWNETRNRGFYTAGTTTKSVQPKNSIKACVHNTQTVIGETEVKLRLLEPAQTPHRIIPQGTILIAHTQLQGGRLQLKISSVETEEIIVPVDIIIYDIDGQQGLHVPYSPEINALTEMAGNMSQSSGTNIMMTQSAGQQIATDLSRGVIQGISGYFAKKVRTPKITLKAGHQLFLVSKQ